MALEDKEQYFVAVKVFLKKDGKLLIMKDKFGDWDLPGGRIRKDEFNSPLEVVVQRKMCEELGTDIKYKIGSPVVFIRHERVEQVEGKPTVRIFAIGYEGTLLAGEIMPSELHIDILWVDPNNFKPEDYFTGGWLTGVKEYLNRT